MSDWELKSRHSFDAFNICAFIEILFFIPEVSLTVNMAKNKSVATEKINGHATKEQEDTKPSSSSIFTWGNILGR